MIDESGYIHDKLPSNNPLIYTGILKAHTGYNGYNSDVFYRDNFKREMLTNRIFVIRKIRSKYEFTSLDEIIGAFLLGLLNADHFDTTWNWSNYKDHKWYRVLQAAIYCIGKHRNFFKYKRIDELWVIAYMIPPHIRHWVLIRENKKSNLLNFMCFYLWLALTFSKRSYKKSKRQTGAVSQKNIACALLKDLNHPFYSWVNWMQHLKDYFGEKHLMLEMIKKAN